MKKDPSTLSNTSPSSPIELRLKSWKLPFPNDRRVELDEYVPPWETCILWDDAKPITILQAKPSAPAALQVNMESRQETQKYYKLLFHKDREELVLDDITIKPFYFDPSVDVFLDSNYRCRYPYGQVDVSPHMDVIKTLEIDDELFIQLMWPERGDSRELMDIIGHWPFFRGLSHIILRVGPPSRVARFNWEPALPSFEQIKTRANDYFEGFIGRKPEFQVLKVTVIPFEV